MILYEKIHWCRNPHIKKKLEEYLIKATKDINRRMNMRDDLDNKVIEVMIQVEIK